MTQGVCKTCGCVCVLDETWEAYGCPACRAARVAEAFKPLDALRTALAVKGVRWHGEEPEGIPEQAEGDVQYCHTCKSSPEMACPACTFGENREKNNNPEQSEDTPRGLRMPKGEQAQTYELRRLFRL